MLLIFLIIFVLEDVDASVGGGRNKVSVRYLFASGIPGVVVPADIIVCVYVIVMCVVIVFVVVCLFLILFLLSLLVFCLCCWWLWWR